jgi:hypothetical protein
MDEAKALPNNFVEARKTYGGIPSGFIQQFAGR